MLGDAKPGQEAVRFPGTAHFDVVPDKWKGNVPNSAPKKAVSKRLDAEKHYKAMGML